MNERLEIIVQKILQMSPEDVDQVLAFIEKMNKEIQGGVACEKR